MPGQRRLPVPQPRLMQGGRRLGRQRTRAAKPRVRQRLQRQQHRRRLIARLARLLREDRERARLLQQGPVALPSPSRRAPLPPARTPLRLGALLADVLGLARLDEIELQFGRLGRVLGPARRPGLRRRDVGTGQKPVRRPAARIPLGRALQIARVLAQPVEIGVERRREPHQPRAESRARKSRLRVEEDVIEGGKLRRRARVLERATEHGKDALAEPNRFLDLPGAGLGASR